MSMSDNNNQLGTGRYFREAMQRIEQKTDRNFGGTLLGKRMVHKNHKAYNRRDVRARDRRGDY
jgi:hypothetical protein